MRCEIPDESVRSVEIQCELKARHWWLLITFLWNHTGCPRLLVHSKTAIEWLTWPFLMRQCVSLCVCMHVDWITLLLVMIYNDNFKCMLAQTYYKQSANMSKHSGNTIWLLYKMAGNWDTAKEQLVVHNRDRARAEERNTTQTQVWHENVLPPISTTTCESSVW